MTQTQTRFRGVGRVRPGGAGLESTGVAGSRNLTAGCAVAGLAGRNRPPAAGCCCGLLSLFFFFFLSSGLFFTLCSVLPVDERQLHPHCLLLFCSRFLKTGIIAGRKRPAPFANGYGNDPLGRQQFTVAADVSSMPRLPTGNGQSRCGELRPLAAASSWDPMLTCAFRCTTPPITRITELVPYKKPEPGNRARCVIHGPASIMARGPGRRGRGASFSSARARAEQQAGEQSAGSWLTLPAHCQRTPRSQGYHRNNMDGLMTARPGAVTGRLLSACPCPQGMWGGVGWGG
ncbi:hypothetical protein P4O66_013719 [Electrophorus voltai]|uniref:Uncharacterized protein n=1 Tax=Electrophorus voltai TaxID=2609070 RepID=A0AAD9DU16_9TELE|nr:hypothetical protein P4O66_013719 [Electrophorus voltai]